jgi:hypothetical protein
MRKNVAVKIIGDTKDDSSVGKGNNEQRKTTSFKTSILSG